VEHGGASPGAPFRLLLPRLRHPEALRTRSSASRVWKLREGGFGRSTVGLARWWWRRRGGAPRHRRRALWETRAGEKGADDL
jgi:hypothetical protein